jgi:tetratricopeptide (TPR) repeat protein
MMSYPYDVFLSHNSRDKPAVEAIGRSLHARYGLQCWLDKWNLVPGEPWQEALEEALDQCQTFAVFVGNDGIGPWENEEYRSALEDRVRDKARRLIPVLLPGAPDARSLKLPRFLRRLTWVDFRAGLGDEEALHNLYCGIRGLEPGPGREPGSAASGGLPSGSYLPFPRNALFTGREADLQSLADNLLESTPANTVISQAVSGMGGIGKTQLAVEFAWRYGGRFRGVHWLDLRDPQALDAAIALCGAHMGYHHVDQRDQVAATLQAWLADGPRLLILDNFEDVTLTHDVLVRFQHAALRVLITSRRRDFPKSAGLLVQALGVFTEAESLQFLEKTLEQPETPAASKALAERLGCLALALDLAAGYLNITKLGVAGYLKELTGVLEHESMLAQALTDMDVTSPTKHDQSLLATFQLSWRELKDETQQKVMLVAGYCAPNTPIPLEIFRRALELEEKALSRAIYRLHALGLFSVDAAGLPAIHPLLAEYARLLAASAEGLLEKLSSQLARLAREANDRMDQTGSLAPFAPLRAHILSTAAFAEIKDIQAAASLLGSTGYYLRRIADFQGARAAYERALKIDEAAFGPDHPKVAIRVNNLGSVLRDLGDLAGARAAFERALKIAEAAFGPDHPKVAIRVNNLGVVLKALGDLAGARAAYERALQIDEAAFGPDHPNVATYINNLGRVLQDLGDLAGARAAYERALKIFEKYLPEGHSSIETVKGNLRSLSKKG